MRPRRPRGRIGLGGLALGLTLLVGPAPLRAGPVQSTVVLDAYVRCEPTASWQHETYWTTPGAVLIDRVLLYAEASMVPNLYFFTGHVALWAHPTGNPYLGYWSPPQWLGPGQTLLEFGGAPVNGQVRLVYGCTGTAGYGIPIMVILYYRVPG